MKLNIASAEIVSVFFMIIILGSLCNKSEEDGKEHNVFFMFALCTTFGLLFDALSYIADERQTGNIILTFVNLMAFSIICICISLFSVYMMMIIRRTKNTSFKPIYPVIIFSALNICMIVLGRINGLFFSVSDMHLVYGPWRDVIEIMPVFSVIYIMFILLANVKSLGRKITLVLGSFVVFPIYAALIFIVFPELELAYLATALSCAVIYTFVRREEIDEVLLRERIMSEISSTDTLTGLLNRRGFNDAIEEADAHQTLGIAFCDLNALKRTNDDYGHKAGDAYIKRFASILGEIYTEQGAISRISGDEFVVLLYDISEEEFNGLKKKLSDAIKRNDRIASAGYAYGESRLAIDLFNMAEKEMYSDKTRYYEETGQDRRRGR